MLVRLPHSHRVSSSFRSQKLKCLNGRNLNVRAVEDVEVQLDSVADTKLPGIKIDNCF